MDNLRLMAMCVIAAVLVMILRQMNPTIAALLSISFGLMVVCVVLPGLREYIAAITAFLDSVSLDNMYGATMMKAMGIVLVTQLAVETCNELEAPTVARRAAFCGRIALLGIAVPVFIALTQMAVDVLK